MLSQQIAALNIEQRSHSNSQHSEEDDDEDVNPFANRREQRRLPMRRQDHGRWESGFKLDIPEFEGSLEAADFLDWIADVEETLDFKDVPQDKRVSLVATRFHGRATAWWRKLKQTRVRQGKQKINSSEKMLKHMRTEFLPHNYSRTLYQELQNVCQGSRSVNDYTTEFYQLITRNDIAESADQLVSRYIGGLRIQFQDALNMLDPTSVSEAHQMALQLEKQMSRRSGNISGVQFGTTRGTSPVTHNNDINQQTTSSKTTMKPQASHSTSSGTSGAATRCFKCGEQGHRMVDCKKGG